MKVGLENFGKILVLLFGGIFHIVLPFMPGALASTMMPSKTLHLVSIGILGAGVLVFLFLREKNKMKIFTLVGGITLVIVFIFSAIEQFRASMTWWGGHYSINLTLGILDVMTTVFLTVWVMQLFIAKVSQRRMRS